jgi:hypothetical protein
MKSFIRVNILIAALALLGAMPADTFAKVSIPLTVTEPSGIARTGEGMKSGVPVKRGEAASADDLILVDDSGRAVPAQIETISKWEDGSVRWALVSFRETVVANGTKRYTLRTRNRGETIPAEKRVTVTDTNDVFTVDTGAVRFDIPIYGGSIISNIAKRDAGGQWTTVSKTGIEAIIWRTGVKKFKSHVEECKVESAGPERTVILIEGHHMLWDHTVGNFDPAELATFKFVARVFCYAGSDEIRLQYTFINDNRDNRIRPSERYHVYAMEELADYKWVNGRWVERPATIKFREKELLDDDYGQINVKDIRLSMTLDDEYTGYRFGVLDGAPSAGSIDGPVALQQVGPVHQYDYFTKDMPFPFTPFKATVLHGMNSVASEFDKAEGWVTMQGPKGSVFLGGKFFWEYHPKVFALDKNRLEYHVWSSIEDIPAPEIGFAKTHEIALRFGAPEASYDTAGIMAGLNRPLMAAATTDHYMSTGVFGTYLDANETMWGEAEAYLLNSAEIAA